MRTVISMLRLLFSVLTCIFIIVLSACSEIPLPTKTVSPTPVTLALPLVLDQPTEVSAQPTAIPPTLTPSQVFPTSTTPFTPEHGNSHSPSISADGNFVAFVSDSKDLLPIGAGCIEPTDLDQACPAIYLYDRSDGNISLVSHALNGYAANGRSTDPVVSANGRYVVFSSEATNMVANSPTRHGQIYLFDRTTNQITLLSRDELGRAGNADSSHAAISWDGRFVVFTTLADNLSLNDQNQRYDIYLQDQQHNTLTRISNNPLGFSGDDDSILPQISGDGRYTAFWSWAGDLVAEDNQICEFDDERYNCGDLFVFDRDYLTLKRIPLNYPHFRYGLDMVELHTPSMSADGRWIGFNNLLHDQQYQNTEMMCPSGDLAGCTGVLSADGRWVAWDVETAVYLIDRITGDTFLASTGFDGSAGNGRCCFVTVIDGAGSHPGASLDRDGQAIAFSSNASNLNPDDQATCEDSASGKHNCFDVYLYNRITNELIWLTYPRD
jgi:Tol biopolymer transport system component